VWAFVVWFLSFACRGLIRLKLVWFLISACDVSAVGVSWDAYLYFVVILLLVGNKWMSFVIFSLYFFLLIIFPPGVEKLQLAKPTDDFGSKQKFAAC
jgi:hypothetical protein